MFHHINLAISLLSLIAIVPARVWNLYVNFLLWLCLFLSLISLCLVYRQFSTEEFTRLIIHLYEWYVLCAYAAYTFKTEACVVIIFCKVKTLGQFFPRTYMTSPFFMYEYDVSYILPLSKVIVLQVGGNRTIHPVYSTDSYQWLSHVKWYKKDFFFLLHR